MMHLPNFKGIKKLLPTHIGGPGTVLPLIVESLLTWALAISCLTVALWHYYIDRYRTRIASADRRQHRCFLPLTTHSRREWATVSDYDGVRTRYDQLLHLIYTTILATQTEVQNEEKKDDKEGNSLDENTYVIVNGKTCCHENQSQDHKDHLQSKGEIVAKWLSTGFVVSQALPTLTSIPPIKTCKPCANREHSDDTRDSREFLIRLFRTNEVARRLASLLLGEDPICGDAASLTNLGSDSEATKTKGSKGSLLDHLESEEPGAEVVLQTLRKIWPQLLELPAFFSNESDNNTETISISIIVPAFREEGGQLATKLQNSLEQAAEPHRIEIIVVHVVEKEDNQKADDNNGENPHDNLSPFAKAVQEGFESTAGDCANTADVRRPVLRILNYHGGGGRGPCLNYGAKHARGHILTFLHADTRLATFGWDKAISKVLEGNGGERITCCAFSFAIDTSLEALTVPGKSIRNLSKCNQQYHPPGLRAIEVTANLRCKFFALPYGDQCLSLPTNVFRRIGGYPDQCLMEDYELIRLLRMRSAAKLARSSNINLDPDSSQRDEIIRILPDYKAICSPRRWQKYGVLYVTYTNSYCVKLYNNGKLTPDELFCQYYGTATSPTRMDGDRSPWESGLIAERK